MMDLMLQSGIFKVEEMLALPDVQERVNLYKEHDKPAKEQLKKLSKVHGNCVVLDLRGVDPIYVTNRFTIYALFPQCNISIHVIPGHKGEKTVFAIGKSIFKKDCKTDIGELCLKYGGGGHSNAGTCQVPNDQAETALQQIIKQINGDYRG
jgi:nanoRNase/pAp phosphatase (c-di-AMP/oligoRNAs hydrolase)